MTCGKLLKPLIQGRADAVYGSRFLTTEERRVIYFWHSIGNKFLTLVTNVLFDTGAANTCPNVTDGSRRERSTTALTPE